METVAIICGGKSAEHEISLISAMNILKALDRSRFKALVIGIDKEGTWLLQDEARFLAQETDPQTVTLTDWDEPIALVPGENAAPFRSLKTGAALTNPVAVLAPLHGPYGEDGTFQGIMRHLHLPFVGSGVLGSAVAMDKDVAKKLLTVAGIPNSPFVTFRKHERDQISYSEIASRLQLPLFVKPACMGSSVGVSKVENEAEFEQAVDLAFEFDRKILVEQGIQGREIECAVLGNASPKGSAIGEIVPPDGFYDYESKYIDAEGAKLLLPAPGLDGATVKRIQDLAVRTSQALECEGLSRVDFFLTEEGELVVNEVNTLPGFTKISMYPSLWGLSGIGYTDLITKLIDLAIERAQELKGLQTSL